MADHRQLMKQKMRGKRNTTVEVDGKTYIVSKTTEEVAELVKEAKDELTKGVTHIALIPRLQEIVDRCLSGSIFKEDRVPDKTKWDLSYEEKMWAREWTLTAETWDHAMNTLAKALSAVDGNTPYNKYLRARGIGEGAIDIDGLRKNKKRMDDNAKLSNEDFYKMRTKEKDKKRKERMQQVKNEMEKGKSMAEATAESRKNKIENVAKSTLVTGDWLTDGNCMIQKLTDGILMGESYKLDLDLASIDDYYLGIMEDLTDYKPPAQSDFEYVMSLLHPNTKAEMIIHVTNVIPKMIPMSARLFTRSEILHQLLMEGIESNPGPQEDLLIPWLEEGAELNYGMSNDAPKIVQGLHVPFHSYTGPGWMNGTSEPMSRNVRLDQLRAPTDRVDAAARDHDINYARAGYRLVEGGGYNEYLDELDKADGLLLELVDQVGEMTPTEKVLAGVVSMIIKASMANRAVGRYFRDPAPEPAQTNSNQRIAIDEQLEGIDGVLDNEMGGDPILDMVSKFVDGDVVDSGLTVKQLYATIDENTKLSPDMYYLQSASGVRLPRNSRRVVRNVKMVVKGVGGMVTDQEDNNNNVKDGKQEIHEDRSSTKNEVDKKVSNSGGEVGFMNACIDVMDKILTEAKPYFNASGGYVGTSANGAMVANMQTSQMGWSNELPFNMLPYRNSNQLVPNRVIVTGGLIDTVTPKAYGLKPSLKFNGIPYVGKDFFNNISKLFTGFGPTEITNLIRNANTVLSSQVAVSAAERNVGNDIHMGVGTSSCGLLLKILLLWTNVFPVYGPENSHVLGNVCRTSTTPPFSTEGVNWFLSGLNPIVCDAAAITSERMAGWLQGNGDPNWGVFDPRTWGANTAFVPVTYDIISDVRLFTLWTLLHMEFPFTHFPSRGNTLQNFTGGLAFPNEDVDVAANMIRIEGANNRVLFIICGSGNYEGDFSIPIGLGVGAVNITHFNTPSNSVDIFDALDGYLTAADNNIESYIGIAYKTWCRYYGNAYDHKLALLLCADYSRWIPQAVQMTNDTTRFWYSNGPFAMPIPLRGGEAGVDDNFDNEDAMIMHFMSATGNKALNQGAIQVGFAHGLIPALNPFIAWILMEQMAMPMDPDEQLTIEAPISPGDLSVICQELHEVLSLFCDEMFASIGMPSAAFHNGLGLEANVNHEMLSRFMTQLPVIRRAIYSKAMGCEANVEFLGRASVNDLPLTTILELNATVMRRCSKAMNYMSNYCDWDINQIGIKLDDLETATFLGVIRARQKKKILDLSPKDLICINSVGIISTVVNGLIDPLQAYDLSWTQRQFWTYVVSPLQSQSMILSSLSFTGALIPTEFAIFSVPVYGQGQALDTDAKFLYYGVSGNVSQFKTQIYPNGNPSAVRWCKNRTIPSSSLDYNYFDSETMTVQDFESRLGNLDFTEGYRTKLTQNVKSQTITLPKNS